MAHPLVAHLRAALSAAANPDKAPGMQAYMKTDQPFYGVQQKERRALLREALKRFKIERADEYETVVRELWAGSHREEMYLALDVAERVKRFRTDERWPLYEHLVRTATNWDTLDWIASKLIGELVRGNRAWEAKLAAWTDDDNIWVRRASLLAHLRHNEDTNTELLARTILKLAGEKEFFIRKAIGWVLRDFSRTDPDWVEDFVAEHGDKLSNLSRREALRNIKRARQARAG